VGDAVGQCLAGFGSHRDPLVTQEISGGDRAAFACRQSNRSFVLREYYSDSERLLVSRRSKHGRRTHVDIQSEHPRCLGVEENTHAVGDTSGDQVAIKSVSARWLPRWRATCRCNYYA